MLDSNQRRRKKGIEGLPRIIRLSRKLKLSEKETLIMIYTLCCQVGESRMGGMARFGRFAGGGVLYSNDTLFVCKACDVKIGEIVEFLNQHREHMKQGIFPDVQQSYMLPIQKEVNCQAACLFWHVKKYILTWSGSCLVRPRSVVVPHLSWNVVSYLIPWYYHICWMKWWQTIHKVTPLGMIRAEYFHVTALCIWLDFHDKRHYIELQQPAD